MLIHRLKNAEREQPWTALSAMDTPLRSHPLRAGHILLGIVVFLSAGVGAYAYARFGLIRSISVHASELTIEPVHSGPFRDYVPVTGTVAARVTVYLDVPTGGQVSQVLAEEGATVSVGQPLVVLGNSNLELDVMGRQAALAEQLYQLTTIKQSLEDRRLQRDRDLTEITYQLGTLTALLERKRPLVSGGYVAQGEVTDLERNIGHYRDLYTTVKAAERSDNQTRPQQVLQLQQSIDLITNNLQLARKNLDNLTIKASTAGVLTSLDAEIGQSKSPGQRIGQIDSIGDYKVRALIDEFYLARIVVGQKANADIEGRTYALDIAKVYPGVEQRQFAIDLKFAGESPRLRRGQTINLNLEMSEKDHALIVPNGAFYDDTGGAWAFVLSPNGREAHRQPVVLGRRTPAAIEVLKGLAEGSRIVTSTYASFLDFDRIDIEAANQ